MLKTDLLQLLTLYCALVSYSVLAEINCEDFPDCYCFHWSDNSSYMRCSYDNTAIKDSRNFKLEINGKSVSIECYINNYPWDEFLNGKTVNGIGPIDSITIKGCPPYGLEERHIVEGRLGIKNSPDTIIVDGIRKLRRNDYQNISGLLSLDLNNKSLIELPVDVFMDLTKLQTLNLGSNNFTTLPKDIFLHNTKLLSFSMSFNAKKLELPTGLLAGLRNLFNVRLIGNRLKSVPEDLLWNSTSLQVLDLSNNLLTELPPSLLKDAIILEKLNLDHNRLASIPEGLFSNTEELRLLDLSFNEFEHINQTTFESLRRLEVLLMNNNKLSFIHENAFFLNRELSTVSFANNHLTMLIDNTGISPFRNNPYLEEINLANNNIGKIFGDWLVHLPLLRKLNLQKNSISKFDSDDLRLLPRYVEMNLQRNKLRTVNISDLEDIAIKHYADLNGRRKVKVQLDGNPFECKCHLYNLLRYINRDMDREVYDYVRLQLSNTKCSGPKNMKGHLLKYFFVDNTKCFKEKWVPGYRNPCGPNNSCDCFLSPFESLLKMNCSDRGLTSPPEYIVTHGAKSVELVLRYNPLVEQPDFTKRGYKKVTSLDSTA